MQKITANDPLSQSADIVGNNIEKLKQLFPSVFTEGKIDFEALRDVLGDEIETDPEYYRFTWPGKQNAKAEARKPSRGTLRPVPEESVDWESTENLYLEGDNLEVLKLLQKSYAGKIKMIYIDPPYNTGKDFVYKDNYKDNLASYNEQFNRYDVEGNLKSSAAETNQEGDARYHSNWLNMMYPRLTLARNLLREDGVIFVSIGDSEVDNLKKICHEIFGESNFIGCAGRISKKANNQGDYWAPNFDYLLTYTKKREYCVPFFGGINYSAYNQTEEEGERKEEKYQLVRLYMTSLDPMRGCNNQRYFIECPDGSFVIPPGENFPSIVADASNEPPQSGKDKVWRWSYNSYVEKKDQIVVKRVRSSNLVNEKGEETNWNVFTKTYLNDVISKSSATPNSFIEDHINQKSSHELKKLNIPFTFAKPSSLITFLSETCRVNDGDIILDFFAGSSSSAHSVLHQNAGDNGNKKFIMVQLPERTNEDSDEFKAGFKTISEIGKERIRRVGKKLLQENPKLEGKLDVGFKVFKLDESNIKTWETDPEKLEQNLLLEDVIKEDRSEQDVIYEILLKYGLDLTLPIQEKKINNQTLYAIGGGALLVCLSDNSTPATAQSILDWIKELGAVNPQVVFKDNAFNTSQDKVNALQLLKSNGIEDVWSI